MHAEGRTGWNYCPEEEGIKTLIVASATGFDTLELLP